MSLKYLGDKNILLAEDDAFNAQLVRSLLKKISDFNVTMAHDGKHTLDILESEQKVDMLLLDIRMPIVTGMDVLKKVRSNKAFDNMPIIIISVDNNEYELKALGANEFVNKPFNIDDLSSKISFCFEHTNSNI